MAFTALKNLAASAARDAAIQQIPGLIEKYEPDIAKALTGALTKLNAEQPQEAQLFLTNWKKLDDIVRKTIVDGSSGGKRTLRRKRKVHKQRK